MALHRLYQPALDFDHAHPGAVLDITGDEGKHAAAVKRLGPGERVEILNGRGLIATAIITAASRRSLGVEIVGTRFVDRPQPEVVIAAPPPKGSRAEMMIEQLSQVGVSRFVPLITQRSVVEPRETRLDKWRTITAVESAKQCGRAWLMEIDEPMSLTECLICADRPLRVLADAGGRPCGEVMGDAIANRPILLLVGPEGGFSEAEREAIDAAGAAPVSLGPHILRVETAAVVGAGLILQAKEQPS